MEKGKTRIKENDTFKKIYAIFWLPIKPFTT